MGIVRTVPHLLGIHSLCILFARASYRKCPSILWVNNDKYPIHRSPVRLYLNALYLRMDQIIQPDVRKKISQIEPKFLILLMTVVKSTHSSRIATGQNKCIQNAKFFPQFGHNAAGQIVPYVTIECAIDENDIM